MNPLTPPNEQEIVLEVADEDLSHELKRGTSAADSEALGLLPKQRSEEREQIASTAKNFIKDLTSYSPQSPEYVEKIREISTLGYTETMTSVSASQRMLESASTSIAGSRKQKNDTGTHVAEALGDLRVAVTDLDPNAKSKGIARVLDFVPFVGDKINRQIQKYENAQGQLDAIVESLTNGRDSLISDNTDLEQEKANQWDSMLSLRDYIYLTESLLEELHETIRGLREAGNHEAADALERDALFAANQRHQDLITQATVATQGYMAMELIRKNNVELIKGVERAQNTTLVALKQAVVIATALGNQKRILDQVDATNEVTNKLIVSTGQSLRMQTERIHAQATASGVSPEALLRAQQDIFATIGAIDAFKVKANLQIEKTVQSLTNQLTNARPYLDRVKAIEQAEQSTTAPTLRQLGR